MKKTYKISNTSIVFHSDEPFILAGNMKAFECDELSNPFECNFVSGNTELPENSKLLFKRQPVSVFEAGGTVFRAYTPILTEKPVALTFRQGRNISVVFNKEKSGLVLRTDNMLNMVGFGDLAQEENEFILHCSFVKTEFGAVLFSGTSGVGKSTRASLWEEYYSAEILNGDRALLSFRDNQLYASGLPIAGSSKIFKNITLPVSAIVFPGKSDKNKTSLIDGRTAFSYLYKNITINTWNSAFCDKATEFISAVVKDVPVYFSKCDGSENSVKEQFYSLFGDRKND